MKIEWEKITIRDSAAVISDVLRKNGIEVTLVGGRLRLDICQK